MGEAMTAEKLRSAPEPYANAIEAARKEIAQLAVQRAKAERRIEALRKFIKDCAQLDGTTLPRTPTYAEHAMRLLERVDHPMTAGQLLDALAAAKTPVRGATRKHQLTTLVISLRRCKGVTKTANGYVRASTRRGSGHGS